MNVELKYTFLSYTMDTSASTNNLFSNGDNSLNGKTNLSKAGEDINLDGVQDCRQRDKCFSDELREFGGNTTHHGVSYVADSNNHPLRR